MKKNLPIQFLPLVLCLVCVLFFTFSAFGQVKNKEYLPSTPSGGILIDQESNNAKPSQASTVIKYYLKNTTEVSLKVYNLLGKELVTLVSQKQGPGLHSAVFNGAGMSEGVYYYQIKIDGIIETKRIIISK